MELSLPRSWLIGLAVGSLALAGCTGQNCSASQTYSGQEAVCNSTNSFSYAYQASVYTKSEHYAWKSDRSKAQVHSASQLGSGSFTVTVKDASGAPVFSKSYSGPGQGAGSETSSAGTPGTWSIDLSFVAVTGQVSLNINAA